MSLNELDVQRGRRQLTVFEQVQEKIPYVRTEGKVIRQGNSFMAVIPVCIAKKLGITRNDPLKVELVNGQIIITPKKSWLSN